MTQTVEHQAEGHLAWALPEGLDVPPDKLECRLDIYSEAILLHQFRDEGTTTRLVSAADVAKAFTQHLRLSSGVLPEGALWWGMGPEGDEVALWRNPQVWKVALVTVAFKPPRRFTLPMPGLVFVCSPGRPPRVFAAKSRPRGLNWPLCKAPLFNIMEDGRSCAGTHAYSQDVTKLPEEFFMAFFTREGDTQGRSRSHPKDLLRLWEELDGKRHYPIRDLVPQGTLDKAMGWRVSDESENFGQF